MFSTLNGELLNGGVSTQWVDMEASPARVEARSTAWAGVVRRGVSASAVAVSSLADAHRLATAVPLSGSVAVTSAGQLERHALAVAIPAAVVTGGAAIGERQVEGVARGAVTTTSRALAGNGTSVKAVRAQVVARSSALAGNLLAVGGTGAVTTGSRAVAVRQVYGVAQSAVLVSAKGAGVNLARGRALSRVVAGTTAVGRARRYVWARSRTAVESSVLARRALYASGTASVFATSRAISLRYTLHFAKAQSPVRVGSQADAARQLAAAARRGSVEVAASLVRLWVNPDAAAPFVQRMTERAETRLVSVGQELRLIRVPRETLRVVSTPDEGLRVLRVSPEPRDHIVARDRRVDVLEKDVA